MLRQFFTTMALTAALTSGADLTMPATQIQSYPPATLAEASLQNPTSLALAQTSVEAAGIKKLEAVDFRHSLGIVKGLLDLYKNRDSTAGLTVKIIETLIENKVKDHGEIRRALKAMAFEFALTIVLGAQDTKDSGLGFPQAMGANQFVQVFNKWHPAGRIWLNMDFRWEADIPMNCASAA